MVHFRTCFWVCSSSDQEQSYHSSAEADMGRIRLAVLIFASLGLLLCVSQEAAAQSSNRLATPAASSTSVPQAGDFLLRDAGYFLPDHARYICHRRPSRSVRICRVARRERSACADGGISFAGWQHLFLKEDAVFDWRCFAGCGHGPGVQERSLTRPTGA